MTQITYREATPDDFPIMQRFYENLNNHFLNYGYRLPRPDDLSEQWLSTFERTLGKYSIAYVAEMEGNVVGFLLARIKRLPPYMGGVLVGELSDEWIEPIARRTGAGDHMCRMALDWLKEKAVHSVEIQVLKGNEPSWNMLSAMGFKEEFRVGRLFWEEYVPKNDVD